MSLEYQLRSPVFPVKNYDNVIEQIFSARGIAPEDIEHYLNTTDDDIIDPSTIDRIKDGAKMLVKHISQGDKIFVQVDSDCDGFTSSAALINYLYCLFPDFVKNNVSYRIHTGKQHGIIYDTVPEDVNLVIAPDSSSNDYEVHKQLHDRGCDVLVIDHHEAEKISEYACIINNQLCDYPNKSLCGVGMVYKFCSYIDSLLGIDCANLFLDLVATGEISDMMDLRTFETRHLVKKGLQQIRNPFLKGIEKKQSFVISRNGGILSPFTVGFYIAPLINATIRVGKLEEKLMLFESMLDYQGYEQVPSTKRGCKGQTETRVEQACRNCTNIKNRQTEARDASLSVIEHEIEENDLLKNKILAIKLKPEYETNKNLTGLIANQLMAKYQHPVLLLNETTQPDGEKSWEGSGRGYETDGLDNFREYLRDSSYFLYAEGHAQAFGAGLLDKDFNNFMKYSNEKLINCNFAQRYNIDFIWNQSDLRKSDLLKIAELKTIWGQGIEEPFIMIKDLKITKDNLKLLSPDKNPTLQISLQDGISIIKFRSSNEEYESLYSELGCVTIDIIGKCDINEWNGNINPQIKVENYEIVGKQDLYF